MLIFFKKIIQQQILQKLAPFKCLSVTLFLFYKEKSQNYFMLNHYATNAILIVLNLYKTRNMYVA